MIEQTGLNAPLRYTKEVVENGKDKLISKTVIIDNVLFGPPEKIQIHRKRGENELYLVKREIQKEYYLYKNNKLLNKLILTDEQVQNDEITNYLYGIAKYNGEIVSYLIQNTPNVRITNKPSYDEFMLPSIFRGFTYNMTFMYNKQLIELIGNLPATYTDKHKRPINSNALKYNLHYPISMDKITSTFQQIANKYDYHMPIVVNLSNTEFGCIDLEPNYTQNDLKLADSFDAYYVEDTPRGGKHYLVKIKQSSVFKYRINDKIEVQANCQITLYGRNGIFKSNNVEYSDFSKYKVIGHTSNEITLTTKPPEVTNIVNNLYNNKTLLSDTYMKQLQRNYLVDNDASHADFMLMYDIYKKAIKPLQSQYNTQLLPWILAEYSVKYLPPRAKHSSERCGVPYLVYVADKIINNQTTNLF